MSADSNNEIRENVHAYFPILKWIWAGVAAVIFSTALVIYNLKIESIELRKELETERTVNVEQDRKIEETYKLMSTIAKEQARIAEAMENLSKNATSMMNRVAEDTKEIRNRVDRHIEKSSD